jgi:Ser/Thr protein kinase RdoA (MazF antagonist)
MTAQDFNYLSHVDQLPLLEELAWSSVQLYALPAITALHLVNLSENATYKLSATDGRAWALRVHRAGYHAREAIASELAWLMDLRRTGAVVTPVPVPGLNGDLIQDVPHPRMASNRHIVLFEWEAGREPGIGEDLSQPFEALGEAAARMHLHVMQWQRPAWFTRHTWDFETALGEAKPHWGRWREGLGVTPAIADMFARTVALIGNRLSAYGQSSERFGLVHGDIRLANVLVDDDAVKVIDFDDCGFSWFMYDAATTVSFYEHEPQVPDLLESWKQGYRRVRALSRDDENEIQTFIMLRRLLLVAWIGTRRDTDLATSMGVAYTQGSVALCERYLSGFG